MISATANAVPVCVALLLFAAPLAHARPAAAPRPNSAARPPQHGKETRDETIRRALADFASPDVTARRRAVLILGKYETPAARRALIRALEDPQAAVRRSALVSMREQSWFPVTHLAVVVGLLRDPDVHIRRIASSAVPEFAGGLRLLLRERPANAPPLIEKDPGEVRADLLAAFSDPDLTVRRNMLEYARLLPDLLDAATLAKRLDDESPEIRIKALEAASRSLPPEEFARIARPLIDDDSQPVRLRLARASSTIRADGTLELLESLRDDEAPPVAAAAALGLLRQGRTIPAEQAKSMLESEALDAEMKRNLLSALSLRVSSTNAYLPALKAALESPDPRSRAMALRALSRGLGKHETREQAMARINDPSERVRRTALGVLAGTGPLPEEDVNALLESPHTDVRHQAVTHSRTLKPQKARRILMELLLDEDTGVRSAAIREFGRRRLEGAHRILENSLRDANQAVRTAAIAGLAALGDEHAAKILESFARANDDLQARRVALRIRLRLRANRSARPGTH